MKALVIDDSRTMRRLLASYLSKYAREIVEGEDGLDGLEKLTEHAPFDLILVDWDMPRMTGVEFVTAVRANPAYAEMKILMITSHNTMEDVGQALEAGATDFLMKPMTEEMLADKLQMLGVVAE